MKLLTIGLIILLETAAGAYAGDGIGGKLKWIKDHDAGLAEARMTGKPVAIYFGAKW